MHEILTFSKNISKNNVSINITNDYLYENDEEFLVKFVIISEVPFPGELHNISRIRILDDDGEFVL